MRLIDANALLKIYENWIPQLMLPEDAGDKRGVETCIAVLQDAPTVDATPVVRCWECEHWKPFGSKAGNSFLDMEYIGCCEFTNYCRSESDFCSYGKRKEGDRNG